MVQLKRNSAYQVEVKTAYGTKEQFWVKDNSGERLFPCDFGIVYVTTDNPKLIYDMFPDVVISIKYVGQAYTL